MPGIENSALADSEGGSLALHLRWQPDRDPEASVPHAASIHVGRIFAAYSPGLVTQLLQFFKGLQPPPQVEELVSSLPSDMPAAAQTAGVASMRADTEAVAGVLEAMPKDRAHVLAPPEWVTGGAVISCSVMSLQLVALSAASLQAEAAALCVERCSVHSGTLRPTARAGSLAAELFAMQKQPLPGHGLRLTVVGARLGVAQHWQQAACRLGSEDSLADAGVRCVSDNIEVQVLVHAASPDSAAPSASGSAGTTHSRQDHGNQGAHALSAASQLRTSTHPATAQTWVAAAAISPLLVTLAGSDVAAVMAIVEGATAETSRKFSGLLPPRSSLSDEVEAACMPATLTLQSSRVQVRYAPACASHYMASEEAETDAHSLVLFCPSASATFCLEEPELQNSHSDSNHDGKGVSVRAMQLMLRARAGFSVSVPACEISIGAASSKAGGSQWSSQDAALFSPCGPPIVLVHNIRLERSSQPESAADPIAAPLTLSIQSMSFSLALQQLTLLVHSNS